jgi:hypothetical protein
MHGQVNLIPRTARFRLGQAEPTCVKHRTSNREP